MNGCADQCEAWAGERGNPPFFDSMVDAFAACEMSDGLLGIRLEKASKSASEAYAEFSNYLRDGYLPDATPVDGVGREI